MLLYKSDSVRERGRLHEFSPIFLYTGMGNSVGWDTSALARGVGDSGSSSSDESITNAFSCGVAEVFFGTGGSSFGWSTGDDGTIE